MTARCVRKTSTSAVPISAGWRFPCQSTKRRHQPTKLSSVRSEKCFRLRAFLSCSSSFMPVLSPKTAIAYATCLTILLPLTRFCAKSNSHDLATSLVLDRIVFHQVVRPNSMSLPPPVQKSLIKSIFAAAAYVVGLSSAIVTMFVKTDDVISVKWLLLTISLLTTAIIIVWQVMESKVLEAKAESRDSNEVRAALEELTAQREILRMGILILRRDRQLSETEISCLHTQSTVMPGPRPALSHENAIRVVRSGIEVASADNDLRPTERVAIVEMGMNLGLDTAAVEAMISEANERNKTTRT